jgi:O-methyltransferase
MRRSGWGTAALMAHGTVRSHRDVHLFDSWSGLPKSSAEDGQGSKKWVGEVVGSPKRVVSIFRRLEIDLKRVTFHRGWFEDTFPDSDISKVALLHIDADFYESVKLCLDKWYPRLSPGGYIQFDDYNIFVGCTRAVDEFLERHPEMRLQTVGNFTKAFFIQKPTSV